MANSIESSVPITGLDIGSSKIVAVTGYRNEAGKIEIVGLGEAPSEGLENGVIVNIDRTVKGIKEAVKKAELASGSAIKFVNGGIAGPQLKVQQQEISMIRKNWDTPVSREELDQHLESFRYLMMKPGEDIFDVIPQDYCLDRENGIKHPVGICANTLKISYNVIIGKTLAAKNVYRCIRESGLDVVGLFLEPFASAEAVLCDDEKETGVVLVDLGSGTTSIAVYYDGILRHTAILPVGSGSITQAIKEHFSVVKKDAERLKVQFGFAISDTTDKESIITIDGLRGRQQKEIRLQNLTDLIQTRINELIGFIIHEISSSGYDDKLMNGIILTGGGAKLQHLCKLMQLRTHYETHIGTPFEYLAEHYPPELSDPQYSAAIGLLVLGIRQYELEKERAQRIKHTIIELPEKKLTSKKIIEKRKGEEKKRGKDKPGQTFDDLMKQSIEKLSAKFRIWFENDINEVRAANPVEEKPIRVPIHGIGKE
ncbi:MAG: cell division protein FtsA [Bacteroidetes bacterium]|nr:cell division protein FtsA [Bacteroidota bacterium]